MGHEKSIYIALRRRYQPVPIRLIIIAESPPDSGKYFYNPEGSRGEVLFREMMKLINVTCTSKDEGLRQFQKAGLFLADATYTPVNKGYEGDDEQRNNVILRDYPLLREDLLELTPDRSVPLILIKVNVVVVLEARLKADGFRVLNDGIRVPFPFPGKHLPKFHELFEEILRRGGIAITGVTTTTREGNRS
jgi:hypothetical protein